VPSSRTLYRFALIPNKPAKLGELVEMAEREGWDYRHTPNEHPLPILFNYLHHTFDRLQEEDKIAVKGNEEHSCWNTGLVTIHQKPIFAQTRLSPARR
jgi:hypothetical protein